MREIEITSPPDLSFSEQRAADLHSLLNVLNILALQLGELEIDFPSGSEQLAVLGETIHRLAHAFREDDQLAPLIKALRDTEQAILEQLDALLKETDFPEHRAQLTAARENFASIYDVLKVRLDEFEERIDDPDLWIEIKADRLREQIEQVFSAIEKNAAGRYYIHFNLALKQEDDYYIDLRIESKFPDDRIHMPLRLKDVLRDLVANARKYTEPGGKVALAVYQSSKNIHCVIEDSGCGIPEDELERVAEFGYRASNVRKYRTMGGGFGLTKAVWLIHSWGGQFKICSGEGEGTRISLTIPNRKTVPVDG